MGDDGGPLLSHPLQLLQLRDVLHGTVEPDNVPRNIPSRFAPRGDPTPVPFRVNQLQLDLIRYAVLQGLVDGGLQPGDAIRIE